MNIATVWTVHNHEAHEGADWSDHLGYRVLARSVDLVVAHTEWSARETRKRFGSPTRLVVSPIGNYEGVYPTARPRDVVLRELGLRADIPMVCMVGMMRGYKGLDVAARAARKLRGQVQFVFAGMPYKFDSTYLTELARENDSVVCLLRSVSDQEYANIIGASEAVLLPYRRVTTSSVLLSVWTLERGVIASDLPFFREIARDEPYALRFFAEGDADSLASAILAYVKTDPGRRSSSARVMSEAYNWSSCVEPFLSALTEVCGAYAHSRRSESLVAHAT